MFEEMYVMARRGTDDFLMMWLLFYLCFNVIYPLLKLQEFLGSDLGLGAENVARIPELQLKN